MKYVQTILPAAVLGMLASPSSAAVHFVGQSNVAAISFSRPDFGDARIDGANTLFSTADAPGDSTVIGWSSSHNINQHVEASGGVTVGVISPGTAPYSYSVSHPTGAPGSHTYSYTRTQPDGFEFYASSVQGVPVLHLEVLSSPLVENTGTMSWAATIPGDWSSMGSGPGQVRLLAYSAGWTLTQPFVFDGVSTRVQFDRQPGTTVPPNIVMTFYGVPSPGVGTLLGLAGLSVLRRRRV